MVTQLCLLHEILRVMVSRSHGILNGLWPGTVSGILNAFVNLVTYGKALLYVFISVYFPVDPFIFFEC